MATLFEYADYKKALKFLTKTYPAEKRGLQTRLAEHLGCQQAYLSRVFAGRAELSQEQALGATDFFKLDHLETEFFLMLVNLNRAATAKLKAYYGAKIDAVRSRKLDIKSRIVSEGALDKRASTIYYSDWSYGAVHMAVACSDYQTIASLAARFSLPEKRVIEILEFLEDMGLVEKKGSRYLHRVSTVHLGSDEDLTRIHHVNWRLRSIEALSRKDDESLNYSSTISCSSADTTKIREVILEAIRDIRAIVRESPSEEVYCYNLDFFQI